MSEYTKYMGHEKAYLQPDIKNFMKRCLSGAIPQPELVDSIQEQPLVEQESHDSQALEAV